MAERKEAIHRNRILSSRKLPPRLALLDDERLAWLVAHGNRRAFATFYERHEAQLYAYCYLLLHDDDDAYDALQATATRALAALQQGDRAGSLRPWLLGIAREEAVSLERHRAASRELRRSVTRSPWADDDVAEERARLALLMSDLRELPERERSALLLRELTGLSHREIATVLGISPRRAKQAIFHARRSLVELRGARSLVCEDIRRMVSNRDGRVLSRRGVRAHLRSCSDCAAFAAAIDTRRADLQALVPPLPPALTIALITRLSQVGAGHRASVTASWASSGPGVGIVGKTVLAATIAATAGAGVHAVTSHGGNAHPLRAVVSAAHPGVVPDDARAHESAAGGSLSSRKTRGGHRAGAGDGLVRGSKSLAGTRTGTSAGGGLSASTAAAQPGARVDDASEGADAQEFMPPSDSVTQATDGTHHRRARSGGAQSGDGWHGARDARNPHWAEAASSSRSYSRTHIEGGGSSSTAVGEPNGVGQYRAGSVGAGAGAGDAGSTHLSAASTTHTPASSVTEHAGGEPPCPQSVPSGGHVASGPPEAQAGRDLC
jgi:RNA polymerase sigma factor (sigma-70 family)